MTLPRNGLPPSFRYAIMRAEAKLNKDPEPPDIATIEEGAPIGLVYGKTRIRSPALVWWGDWSERANVVSSGPSGQRSFQEQRVGMAFGLAIGITTSDLTAIWVGDIVVWSGSMVAKGVESDGGYEIRFGHPSNPEADADSTKPFGGTWKGGFFDGRVRWYPGNATQTENAYLTTVLAEDGQINTAHRGTSYVVMYSQEDGFAPSGFEVGRDERPPPIHFELSNYPDALTGGTYRNIDGDANPAEVIYDILTGATGRLGLPTSLVDTASFTAAAEALHGEIYGGISFAALATTPAIDIVNDILRHIDAVLYVEPLTNQVHLRLIREDYTIGELPTFDDSDLVENGVLLLEQDLGEETIDEVKVIYEDRIANYYKRSGTAQNMAVYHSLSTPRPRPVSINFPMVRRIQAAIRLAGRELLTMSTPMMTARLAFKRTAFDLRPGDVFLWTHAEFQIVNRAMRVIAVDWGTKADGRIIVDCARDVFAFDKVLFDPPDFAAPPVYDAPTEAIVRKTFEMPQWFGYVAETQGKVPSRDNIRLFYMAEPPTVQESGFRAYTSVNGNPYFTTETLLRSFGQSARVDTAYPHDAEPYDTSLGLVLKNVDSGAASLLVSATEAEIRAGANMLLVGDELIAFESATDLGSNRWRLNNVWRGMLDTVPQDHAVDEVAWFVVSPSIFLRNLGSFGFSDGAAVDVKLPTRSGITGDEQEIDDLTADSLTIASRSILPYPPSQVLMVETSPGNAFSAIANQTASNDYPGEAVAGEANPWLVTSEILAQWRRRQHSTTSIRRGDDDSEAVVFGTEYQVDADAGAGYVALTSGVTGSSSIAPLAGVGAGAGTVRVRCTRDTPSPTRTNWQDREVPAQFAYWRQQLINPHFDDSPAGRGWTETVASDDAPVYVLDSNAFGFTGTYITAEEEGTSIVEQVVSVAGLAPVGWDALLSFQAFDLGAGSGGSVEVTLAAEDSEASELASETTGSLTVSDADWEPYTIVMSPIPDDTTQLRVTVAVTHANGGVIDGAVDAMDLRIAPAISAELVVNGDFATDLTGWTASNMLWAASGGMPGTSGVALGDEGEEVCSLYQDITLPVGAAIGDIVHLRAHHSEVSPSTGALTLQQRNGAAVEVEATTGEESLTGFLHVRDLYLKLSAVSGRTLRVIFDGDETAGDLELFLDTVSVRIYSPTVAGSVPQWPETAADLASVLPNLGLASNIWAITETTVETLVDSVGSDDMAVLNSTGLSNADASNTVDFPGKRAITFSQNQAGAYGIESATHAPGTDSWIYLEVRRIQDCDNSRFLVDRRSAGGGYSLQQLTGDSFRVVVGDGTTTQNINSSSAMPIGSDLVCIWGVDRAAGEIVNLAHDGSSAVSTVRTALTATGAHDSAAGRPLAWGKPSGGTSAPGELIYSAFFRGTAAEGVTIDDAADFAAHIGL